MKNVSIVEIFKFLKYMNLLSLKRFYWQLKSRYWCTKKHNQWEELPMIHGAGRYVYMGYRCNKCKLIHYEFKINKP